MIAKGILNKNTRKLRGFWTECMDVKQNCNLNCTLKLSSRVERAQAVLGEVGGWELGTS
jgi:hypothetical protein